MFEEILEKIEKINIPEKRSIEYKCLTISNLGESRYFKYLGAEIRFYKHFPTEISHQAYLSEKQIEKILKNIYITVSLYLESLETINVTKYKEEFYVGSGSKAHTVEIKRGFVYDGFEIYKLGGL